MTSLEYILKCTKENFLKPYIFLEIKDNRLVIEEESNMDRPGTLKRLTVTNIPDNSFAISFDYSGNRTKLTFKDRLIRNSKRKLRLCLGILGVDILLVSLILYFFPTELEMFVVCLLLAITPLVVLTSMYDDLITHYRKQQLPSPVNLLESCEIYLTIRKNRIVKKIQSIFKECYFCLLNKCGLIKKKEIYGQLSWALSKRNEKINRRCDFIIVTPKNNNNSDVNKYMVVLGEMKSETVRNYSEQLLNSYVFMKYVIKLVNEFNPIPKPNTKQKISANCKLVVISNSSKIKPFETRRIGSLLQFSIGEISVYRVDSHAGDDEDGVISYDKLAPSPVIASQKHLTQN